MKVGGDGRTELKVFCPRELEGKGRGAGPQSNEVVVETACSGWSSGMDDGVIVRKQDSSDSSIAASCARIWSST